MKLQIVLYLPRHEQRITLHTEGPIRLKDVYSQIDMDRWSEKDVLATFNGEVCFADDLLQEDGELDILPLLSGG